MNKKAAGIRLHMFKGFCLALTLILGASLFAGGAFAESGCGEKCCSPGSPMDMHHSKGELIPVSAGFCNGDPMIPCNLETGQSSGLPQFIPGSVDGNLTYSDGPVDILADSFSNRFNLRSGASYLLVQRKFQSAPIYLQNVSFLI